MLHILAVCTKTWFVHLSDFLRHCKRHVVVSIYIYIIIILYYIILYYILLYYIIFFCIILYYIFLYDIILYHMILYFIFYCVYIIYIYTYIHIYIYTIKLIVNTKRKECHFLKILEPCSTKPRSQLWKPFPSEPVTSPWLKSKPPAQLPEPSPATGSSWMINCTHQNGMNFTYPKLQKFILDVCGNE